MLAIAISMLTLGLVTSIHCVSMCGPMVVTYAVKGEENGPWHRKLLPNAAYQVAKITSYVIVGMALGAIGSAFNLDGVRPYIMGVAGVFMIIMGLGMTGKVSWAARLTPRPPKLLVQALSRTRRKANEDAAAGESTLATPITFGLLTGLMPCAPLMAAQLAAAGTGSVLGGAVAMLAFGIGTAPLMMAFGTASSMLPKNLKSQLMSVLAIVVIVFGAVYVNRAATRLGSPVTFNTAKQAVLGTPVTSGAPADAASYKTGTDGVVEVPLVIENVRFQPSTLQIPEGKAVRLLVDRREENACSAQLSIPQLGISAVDLKPNGITAVDIPASKAGNYTLTCGMGMMSGQLSVGIPAVASTGAGDSKTVWLMFTLAFASAALWVGRRTAPAGKGTVTEDKPSTKRSPGATQVPNAKPAPARASATPKSTPKLQQTVTQTNHRPIPNSGDFIVFAGLTGKQLVLTIAAMALAAIAGLVLGSGGGV